MRSFFSISSGALASILLLAPLAHADSPQPVVTSATPPATSLAASINSTQSGTADVHLAQTTSTNRPAWARFASGTGTALFVAGGTLLPLIEDGKDGSQHSIRTADSLITSTLITEALKNIVHEKRPDGSDYKSFPSGHATAAFAVATMQAHFHPNQAIFWYAGATAIAASRVKLRRHFTKDVIAGAAIGILTSELEIRQRRGLLLFPFIHGSKQERTTGVSVGGTF